ncbi:tetratricopeptide repeat protein [Actinospica sp.]|uniref:tetratricopeptide repeat protein n=1 Tax=Actinospica sp. TaxID=1872142 RepID=UPI002C8C6065|nr:tetratricopeptide repeat protein [Actinospica sp.]HWG26042.1 tetratricopeptide repeat protein [Actinospica sp.]
MHDLISLDGRGRMVPRDRAALEQLVDSLSGETEDSRRMRQLGVGLLVLGRHSEALRVLRAALAMCEHDGETARAAAIHINMGDAHRYGGDLSAAEPHYQAALGIAEATAPELLAYAWQHLGKQRLDEGRTAEARSYFNLTLAARETSGDSELAASARAALRLVDAVEGSQQ